MTGTIQFGDVSIPSDERSLHAFEFFRTHSPEMVGEMKSFMEHARGKKCFIDVGALYGVFSLVFSAMNPEGRAFAIEPHPKSFEILSSNADLVSNVQPVMVALSDRAGELSMHQEWDIHYVAGDGPNAFNASESNELSSKCITGDMFCLGLKPDIIKIDVEGHELMVLRGLRETIAAHHPVILLEIHPTRVAVEGYSLSEISTFLSELGYTGFDTFENQPISFEEINHSTAESRILFT